MGELWGALIIVTLGVGAVFLGLVLVRLAIGVFKYALVTACTLFEFAAEQGFVGVTLYVILWVIALPFMIIVCIVGGVNRWWQEVKQGLRHDLMMHEWLSTMSTKLVNSSKPSDLGTPE